MLRNSKFSIKRRSKVSYDRIYGIKIPGEMMLGSPWWCKMYLWIDSSRCISEASYVMKITLSALLLHTIVLILESTKRETPAWMIFIHQNEKAVLYMVSESRQILIQNNVHRRSQQNWATIYWILQGFTFCLVLLLSVELEVIVIPDETFHIRPEISNSGNICEIFPYLCEIPNSYTNFSSHNYTICSCVSWDAKLTNFTNIGNYFT